MTNIDSRILNKMNSAWSKKARRGNKLGNKKIYAKTVLDDMEDEYV